MDWATDSIKKKQSEFARERIRDSQENKEQCENNFILSGGDALRGNTRPHPEHDG